VVISIAGKIRRAGFEERVLGIRKKFAPEIPNRLSDCGGERESAFEGRLDRYSADAGRKRAPRRTGTDGPKCS
jgi:hypothetical protein